MIKGAIFDLDGTLLDSMHVWHEIDHEFLKVCGVDIPDNLGEILKAKTIDECIHYFITELGVNLTKEEVLSAIGKLMKRAYLTKIELKPYARQILLKYQQQNIKMCVATANDYDLTYETLKRLDILRYFEFIATCGQQSCSKTEPYIYLHCAEKLGTKPDETIVFEDALHCVEAAKGAGFKVVGVYDESSKNDAESIKKVCDQYIKSFETEISV